MNCRIENKAILLENVVPHMKANEYQVIIGVLSRMLIVFVCDGRLYTSENNLSNLKDERDHMINNSGDAHSKQLYLALQNLFPDGMQQLGDIESA